MNIALLKIAILTILWFIWIQGAGSVNYQNNVFFSPSIVLNLILKYYQNHCLKISIFYFSNYILLLGGFIPKEPISIVVVVVVVDKVNNQKSNLILVNNSSFANMR